MVGDGHATAGLVEGEFVYAFALLVDYGAKAVCASKNDGAVDFDYVAAVFFVEELVVPVLAILRARLMASLCRWWQIRGWELYSV